MLSDSLQAAVEQLREDGTPVDREPAVDLDGNQIEPMHLSEESPQWRTARSAERGGP